MSERITGKGRERVIRDIETVEQAVKAEKDVESGYHGVIEENITYWLAVEEDIVDSYTRLLEQTQNEKIRETLTAIIEDSKKHAQMLAQIRDSFSKILSDEQRHAKLLQGLADEFHK